MSGATAQTPVQTPPVQAPVQPVAAAQIETPAQSSVSSLKSVFEKKPAAPVGPPGKSNISTMLNIVVPAKNPADSGWIKKTEEVKQEQPKPVAQPIPK